MNKDKALDSLSATKVSLLTTKEDLENVSLAQNWMK